MLSGRDSTLPFRFPARFLLTGTLALAAAFTALAVHPEWLLGWRAAPAMLAVVHTLTLLFVTLTFAGAAQQLAPVLLATPLRSVAVARWSYPLIAGGAIGVVGGFAFGYHVPALATGGVLALAGLASVAWNLLRTAAAARRRDVASVALIASFGYLLLTVLMGTLLALSRRVPGLGELADALPLHLGLGLFGAFFLGIAGAGHKLVGMFVLSHGVGETRLRTLTIAVHVAMAALVAGTFLDARLHLVAAMLLGVAVVLLLVDTGAHLRARRRRPIEPAIRHWLAACGFLALAAGAAALGAWTAAVAGFLAGFLPILVAGMGVKILAFLAWQDRYAPKVGTTEVPLLRDLPLGPLEPIMLWGLIAGGLGVTLAYLTQLPPAILRVATVAGAAGAWAYVAQGLWIVFADHAAGARHAPRRSKALSQEAS